MGDLGHHDTSERLNNSYRNVHRCVSRYRSFPANGSFRFPEYFVAWCIVMCIVTRYAIPAIRSSLCLFVFSFFVFLFRNNHSKSAYIYGSTFNTFRTMNFFKDRTISDLSFDRKELFSLTESSKLAEALTLFKEKNILSAPVFNAAKEYTGTVSIYDIMMYVAFGPIFKKKEKQAEDLESLKLPEIPVSDLIGLVEEEKTAWIYEPSGIMSRLLPGLVLIFPQSRSLNLWTHSLLACTEFLSESMTTPAHPFLEPFLRQTS